MKTAIPFLPLAMTSVASAANVEPCGAPTARVEMAATLRLGGAPGQHYVPNQSRGRESAVLIIYFAAKYPDEMTIVLQYEFAQLNVRDDRFEVVLWFRGYPERLVVPFNAIKAFYDRSEPKCFDN